MRIVSTGTRFFPQAHAGDKTFWLDLFRRCTERGDDVWVINVDTAPKPLEHVGPKLTIETMPAIPFFLRVPSTGGRYNPDSLKIGAITNYASKTLTLPRLIRRVARRAREWNADTIHFMDNMGPATRVALGKMPAATYGSAITYDPRGPLYDRFLSLSLAGFAAVTTTSEAFRSRLIQIGLHARKVRTVRWGGDPRTHVPSSDRVAAKAALGLSSDAILVFWSGFIQQVSEADFNLAYRVAEEVRRVEPRVHFWFCFKSWHFRPAYRDLERPGIACRGDSASFERARAAADVFLSPVLRPRSILAPPLTWVETMLRGVPILTTPNPGTAEALGDGLAGEAVAPDQLAVRLIDWVRDPPGLRDRQTTTREWGLDRYSLDSAVDGFRAMWSGNS